MSMPNCFIRLQTDILDPDDEDSDDDSVEDDLDPDDHNDGVLDDEDACPYENTTGFDADGDGCIDSLGGFSDVIDTLLDSSVIDETMETFLKQMIYNANSSDTKENICADVNQLEEGFKNQVEAHRNNKISNDAANLLIEYADNVIAGLLSQLPPGESC